jgi:hypothetical protein
VSNAELYDPSTGAFSLAGPYVPILAGIPPGVIASAAALLANGEVLIASEPSAQVYDADTNTFNVTGSMTQDRHPLLGKVTNIAGRIGELLPDGKVLLAGGAFLHWDTDYGWSNGAELYDPVTGQFTPTGNLMWKRMYHTTTLLSDGSVLIAGGATDNFLGSVFDAEIYSPASASFVPAGFMTAIRVRPQATLLNDGRVLITGGELVGVYANFTVTSSAEVYTPAAPKTAPVLLALAGDGRGQGAIQHSNTTRIASGADPAAAGDYLTIYLSGLQDGNLIPPQVSIGGQFAEVTFFGKVAGYSNLDQMNVRVPAGITPGSEVPVRLMYLKQTSNEVTIGLR